MPNSHGQVTDLDFTAPPGQLRLIQESMEDGHLSILGDFLNHEMAREKHQQMKEDNEKDVFSLCDDQGGIET